MLQTFPLNLLFNNARLYLSPSSETLFGSRNNSYESLKDASDIIFSTPGSSPRTPGPETLTTFRPSVSPVTTPTATQSSLCILPFPPSQTSLAPKPDPTTPSLLDTSISFARMMDRTGSPASFLTCSSGWDPGIVRGAVTFPSLLHSRPSIDNLNFTQDTHWVPSNSKAEAECSLWEAKLSRVSQSLSKGQFTVTTPVYVSPSLKNAESAYLLPPDLATSAPPRTTLEPQPPSPNSKYSPALPQTASPGSEFSLEESTTSSAYDHDPFHWDTVLDGLPPSPQRSPTLAVTVGEPLSIRPFTASSIPSVTPCYTVDAHSPERNTMGSYASPVIIPTIVVLNPDSVMVPTQASVSSIIGLYDNRRESTQTVTGELLAPELQTSEDEPEQTLDEDYTDGEDSSPESEFEIVAVQTLKVRLDTILETDEMDVENAFNSLMTLESIASGNAKIPAAEEQTSTEFQDNGRPFSSFSSVTESSIDVAPVFSSGQIVQSDPNASTSISFASTAELFYTQSRTSISGQSTTNSCHPTTSGSESDCPWLFCVEDGKILEVPRSSSVHGGGKFADKLARFPNVPKSPQLTPLPSPFASPLPSPSAANPYFIGGSLPAPDNPKKLSGPTMDVAYAGSLLSPHWERNPTVCASGFSPGVSILYQPSISLESSSIGITFGDLGVDLELCGSFGSLVSDTLPTDSSSSSGHGTKLSTAQSATPSYGRHVRFETADFRTSGMAMGSKRHSPHHRRPPLNRSKTCMKKRRSEKANGRRNSSDASSALVRSPGVDYDHLPSSFSSGSISKRGPWWQHGRLFVAIGRVRRGFRGCLSSQGGETLGDSIWVTEREYRSNHLSKGESKRSGDPVRGGDGRALLRRIRRYFQ